MSSVVISGDSSGTVSLTVPSVAGTNTATLPAATGTVMVSGNMPAFSVNNNSSLQTIPNNTNTKVQFSTKTFDTANAFDNTTNYRFTPQVAGYYQFTLQIRDNSGPSSGQFVSYIYKNGSTLNFGVTPFAGGVGSSTFCNALVYMNGSTDYVEAYVSQNSGASTTISYSPVSTYFMGSLVRAA